MAPPISRTRNGGYSCEFGARSIYLRTLTLSWVVLPPRMPVTTRIITFLVGDPYKPSFATVTGRGDNPNSISFLLQSNAANGTCTMNSGFLRAEKVTSARSETNPVIPLRKLTWPTENRHFCRRYIFKWCFFPLTC